jgi:hypothetical protein
MIEEWRWYATVVGLVLDVFGAGVIALPVIKGAKGARQGFNTTEAALATMREASGAKWGASILTVGFLLQLVAVAWPRVAAPQAAGGTPMITDWIIAVLTFVIAVFTFRVWRVYWRIAWLTGSMETHSNLMLRLQALKGGADGKPIELVWWDPTIEDAPGVREHGKPVDMKRIHIYLPPELRRNKPPLWKRLWTGQP